MEIVLSIAAALGALLVGVVSPGPSFLLIARTSMATSRKEGLFASLGMGLGAVVFAILVLLGLQVLLNRVPWLYFALQIVGALYLLFIAFQMFRKAKAPFLFTESEQKSTTPSSTRNVTSEMTRRAFLLGLFTQMSNPKTAIVYGSVFAALLPKELPPLALFILPVLIFIMEAGWYSIVALLLSAASPRKIYLRTKTGIDRTAGGILALLGLKILVDAGANAGIGSANANNTSPNL